LAGIPASRLGHVFHEPGDQQGLRGTLEVMLARGVRVAANAPSTARWVDRRLGGHADVLPPAVKPVPLVDRSAAREALGIPADAELVIGVVGRLSPVKMPELAVAAAARLASGRALVVFVGDGPERDRLRRIGAESGVAVSLPGRVPQAVRLLSAFDVLAVPSPYETFGLALAEAAAAAIPVAAVDSPGARTVAEACGMTTPCAATAAGLGAAIASALDEPSDVRAERAERVLAAFGPEATAGRVRAYFEAFTGSAPDARR
jgi:glycosyltransferase involved in cell wall biosynthesis